MVTWASYKQMNEIFTEMVKHNRFINAQNGIYFKVKFTRSSMTSAIACLAPSTHCLAPLIRTLSLVDPDRGKTIMTPPFSSDIS